jgi:hypothetical protein
MAKRTEVKPKVVHVDKQSRLNRLLVTRTLTGTLNPEIEKLQRELDELNYGIVKK